MTLFDLAKKNIKGNFRRYFVYVFSMLLSVMIYYVFVSLQYSTEIMQAVETSTSMNMVFMMASLILIVFVAIFIWYSNQFFTRKRKKEIGLYALFGLSRRTIGRMLFYENLLLSIIVLTLGVAAGTLLSKLFGMILVRLLDINTEVGITFSWQALCNTAIVFAAIMMATSWQAYRLIYRFKLIELFHAEKKGELMPRSSTWSAILAVVCLAVGYAFAFRDWSDNHDIMLNFSVMAIGITIGTFLFFSSLVIFVLNAAKRHKRSYYNGMNLVITSNLVYRMKSNARSLSIISLLSAVTMCAFSFGFASYYGYEQSVRMTAPFSYMFIAQDDAFNERIDSIIREDAAHPVLGQASIPVIALSGEASSTHIVSQRDMEAAEFPIKLVAISDYNEAATMLGYHALSSINPGQAVAVRPLYTDLKRADYEGQTITLAMPDDGSVTLNFVDMTMNRIVNWSYPDIMVVVSDEQFERLAAKVQPVTYIGYVVQDQKRTKETSDALAKVKTAQSKLSTFYSEYRLGIETAALNVFILGFLGLTFMSALGSMIYFKQLTEAEDDKPRYDILAKLGVSNKEVSAAIGKQSAWLFLLPLLVGIAHYLIILQWLKKLFASLGDVGLLMPIVICVAVFVMIYVAYYVLTVRSISNHLLSKPPRKLGAGMFVILAGFVALMGTLLFLQSPAPHEQSIASERLTLALPEPTGPYPIGTVELHLKDADRIDPWAGDQPRELMISIWYPAAKESGQQALYMQPGAAEHYDATVIPTIGLEPGRIDISGIDTHAWVNAATAHPAQGSSGWPVVVYTPGGSVPRSLGTILVSELASRGYIVVTVDHTHEAAAVEFPDGRVITGRLTEMNAETVWKMLEVRVADVRYVLDQLTAIQAGEHHDAINLRLPEGLINALDLSKVGIFGHSAGGATAAQAMFEDARFAAGINMDGSLGFLPDHLLPVALEGLHRPFMLLNAGYNEQGVDSHLTAVDRGLLWQHSNGWKLDISVPHGAHFSFIDHQYILPALSSRLSLSARVLEGSIGTADPEEVLEAQRAYVTAFFDQHLKQLHQPLLEQEISPYAVAEVIR